MSWTLVNGDVEAGWPVGLTEDANTIGFILGRNVFTVTQRNPVMVGGTVGTPEENGTGWGVGDVVVVRPQVCLLISRPGAQAKGVLNQTGAVEATHGAATVDIGHAVVRNSQGFRYGTTGVGCRGCGRRRVSRGMSVAGILNGRACRPVRG